MGLLIFFFLLSIGFSFLCSILEAVLLSVTPSFITSKLQSGSATGKLLAEYKEDIDRPLSAILTLNTIAHTVGAIGVGAQAGAVFSSNEPVNLGFMSLSWESIVAAVMTLAILILSEIIPKTIGANNWRSLSGFSVYTIKILIFILLPFVWVSQLITKTFKKEKNKSVLSRADFAAMTQVGESSGALKKHESLIISNLLNFEQQTVRDIMTPRTVAFFVSEDDKIVDIAKKNKTFSRIPVYKNDPNNVTGVVLKDDILSSMIDNQDDKTIKDIMRDIINVKDVLPLPKLFDMFVKEKQHLFVVRDEFGTIVGIVTMEDLFETLLGQEIVDESDKVIDLQEYARQKFDKDS